MEFESSERSPIFGERFFVEIQRKPNWQKILFAMDQDGDQMAERGSNGRTKCRLLDAMFHRLFLN